MASKLEVSKSDENYDKRENDRDIKRKYGI